MQLCRLKLLFITPDLYITVLLLMGNANFSDTKMFIWLRVMALHLQHFLSSHLESKGHKTKALSKEVQGVKSR